MKRPFFGAPPDADCERSREALQRALQRHEAIAPITPGEARYVEGRTLAEQVRLLQKEGHPLKPSVQTLSAWRSAFLRGGRRVAALLDGQRGGAGAYRGKMANPEMQSLVSQCEQELIQTKGSVYPPIPLLRSKILGRVGAARADAVPSGKAIDRYRRKAIPRANREFLVGGERGYLTNCAPKPPAQLAKQHGVMLVIDHRQADIKVKYGDKELRPWMTVATDPFSGACRGFVTLPAEPGSTEVGLVILDAIRQKVEDPEGLLCGTPEELYSDMGRDLRSLHIQAALRELGVKKVLARGYSPWTRGSHEGNFNKTMAERFEGNFPGYVGNSTKNRPPLAAARLTYDQWAAAARRWALLDFNLLVYPKKRLPDGQKGSRLDFARANRAPVQMPTDKALYLALMKSERRVVQPNGISVGGTFIYWNDALFTLAEERATVEIRFDPADMSRVYVFHRGELFCEATDARAAAAGATEKDNRQRHRLRAERVKALREASEPARMAAMSGDAYLEFMQREQVGEAQAVAAVAGQRPIRQITRFDRAAQKLGTGRAGRGPRPLSSRANSEDHWKDPLDRPIAEEPTR